MQTMVMDEADALRWYHAAFIVAIDHPAELSKSVADLDGTTRALWYRGLPSTRHVAALYQGELRLMGKLHPLADRFTTVCKQDPRWVAVMVTYDRHFPEKKRIQFVPRMKWKLNTVPKEDHHPKPFVVYHDGRPFDLYTMAAVLDR